MNAPPPIRRSPFSKANSVISFVEGVQRVHTQSKEFWTKHFEYSVVVTEGDSLYFEVHKWLINALPDEKNRALSVFSGRGSFDENEPALVGSSSSSGYKVKPLFIQINESMDRKVMVGNFTVKVSLEVPDSPEGGFGGSYSKKEPRRIKFTATTHAAQKAVLAQLEEINQNRATSRKAVLKMVGQWGDWTTRSDLPPRTMESVNLPEEQKERILSDLKNFLSSEEKYNRLAIPWHRGYMFHGPPGTGKTSLAKALANECNLDLWYISLSDLNSESSLLQLLASVGPRSLLLLEDIDTMRITHDRDGSEQGKISMSSLLNTLDGVATPHGLITVMTTNRFEVLDPALTRAGRMDLIEMLDYPTIEIVAQMYKHFYGVKMPMPRGGYSKAPYKGISTSQVAEVMKRNMSDSKQALIDIRELLKGE